VPPDDRGLITKYDSAALVGFRKLRSQSFATNLLKQADTYYEFSQRDFSNKGLVIRGTNNKPATYGINLQNFVVELKKPTKINCIVLREAIHLGQSIRRFSIVFYKENKVAIGEIEGTSVGHKRVLTFPATTITSFRVYLEDAQGNDNITGIGAYLIDESLVEKK